MLKSDPPLLVFSHPPITPPTLANTHSNKCTLIYIHTILASARRCRFAGARVGGRVGVPVIYIPVIYVFYCTFLLAYRVALTMVTNILNIVIVI